METLRQAQGQKCFTLTRLTKLSPTVAARSVFHGLDAQMGREVLLSSLIKG